MASREIFHGCHGGQSREALRISPWSTSLSDSRSPQSLKDWFDGQLTRMQEEIVKNNHFNVPHMAQMVFDPQRRSRLFDAMFRNDESTHVKSAFHENPNKNQIECHLNTGCGDFFRPEDIQLKVNDRELKFIASREQESDDGNIFTLSEIQRRFIVPETADIENLYAEMVPNGNIVIAAPLLNPKSDKPVSIKIERD